MFESKLIAHIDRRAMRSQDLEAARLRKLQNIEILRQASVQSSLVHKLRGVEQRFVSLSRDLSAIVHQIVPMLPVIVWIWDSVKDSKKFREGLESILTHIRSHESLHHVSDLMDLYNAAVKDPEGFFKDAIDNLVALTQNHQVYIEDPVKALKEIHEIQDKLFLSNAFILLLIDCADNESLINSDQTQTLKSLVKHVDKVEAMLGQKEKAMFQEI